MTIVHENLKKIKNIWNAEEHDFGLPHELFLLRRQLLAVAIAMYAQDATEYCKAINTLTEHSNTHVATSESFMDWNLADNQYDYLKNLFTYVEEFKIDTCKSEQATTKTQHNALACVISEPIDSNTYTQNNTLLKLNNYNHKLGLTLLSETFSDLKIFSYDDNECAIPYKENFYYRPNQINGKSMLYKDNESAIIFFGQLPLNVFDLIYFFQRLSSKSSYHFKNNNSLRFDLSKLLLLRGHHAVLDAHLTAEAKRLQTTTKNIIETQHLLFYAIVVGNLDTIKFIHQQCPASQQQMTVYDPEYKKTCHLTPPAFVQFLLNRSRTQTIYTGKILDRFNASAEAIIKYFKKSAGFTQPPAIPVNLHNFFKEKENASSITNVPLTAKNDSSQINNAKDITTVNKLEHENASKQQEINSLKKEVERLKKIINDFTKDNDHTSTSSLTP